MDESEGKYGTIFPTGVCESVAVNDVRSSTRYSRSSVLRSEAMLMMKKSGESSQLDSHGEGKTQNSSTATLRRK